MTCCQIEPPPLRRHVASCEIKPPPLQRHAASPPLRGVGWHKRGGGWRVCSLDFWPIKGLNAQGVVPIAGASCGK